MKGSNFDRAKYVAAILIAALLGLQASDSRLQPCPVTQDETEGFEGDWRSVWEEVRDDGFSHFSKIDVVEDAARAHGGKAFLRMITLGGTTAFQHMLKAARRVTPGQTYKVEGFVRLVGTKSNTAYVELRWLDRTGRAVQVDRTIPLSAATDWTPVALEVPAVAATAQWVQIRLVFDGTDVRGEAHFDDISLRGQPRLLVEPVGRPLPVYSAKETAAIRVTAPALPTGHHSLRLRLMDLDGQLRAPERVSPLDPEKPITENFVIPEFGYFELHAEARDGEKLLASRIMPILAPPPFTFTSTSGRTLGATINPYRARFQKARAMVSLLGLRIAKIVIWDRTTGPRSGEPDAAEILGLFRDMLETEGVGVTAVIARAPESIFPTLDRATIDGGAMALFSLNRRQWETPFRGAVSRYRELASAWQIGADDDESAARRGGVDETLAGVEEVLRDMKRGAILGMPIASGDLAKLAAKRAQFLSVITKSWSDPASYSAETVPGSHLTMSPRPQLTGERASALRDQVADLVKKLVNNASAASGTRPVYLPLTELVDVDGYPGAAALACRTANDILSGALEKKNQELFPPPIQTRVFEKEGKTFVALWSDAGPQDREIALGYNVRLIDPLGGATTLKLGERIVIGKIPIFIVGVDPFLLQTQLALQFYTPESLKGPKPIPNPEIPLRRDASYKVLRLQNFYQDALSNVRIEIVRESLPSGWEVSPLILTQDKLESGKLMDQEVAFQLPQTEQDGARDLTLKLSYERESKKYDLKSSRAIVVAPEIEVRIRNVVPTGQPNQRRVSITVFNRSGRTMTLKGTLLVPGQQTTEVLLPGIKDGTEYDKPIIFNVDDVKADMRAQLLLSETEGRRTFVNKVIELYKPTE